MLLSSSSSRSKKLRKPVSSSLTRMRASKRSPPLRISVNLLQSSLLTLLPDKTSPNLNRSRTKSLRKLRKSLEAEQRKADLSGLIESRRAARREKRVVVEAEARTMSNLSTARRMPPSLNKRRTSQVTMKIRRRAKLRPTPSLTKFLKPRSRSWKMLRRKSKLDQSEVDKIKLTKLPKRSRMRLMTLMLKLLPHSSHHLACLTWLAWDSRWLA